MSGWGRWLCGKQPPPDPDEGTSCTETVDASALRRISLLEEELAEARALLSASQGDLTRAQERITVLEGDLIAATSDEVAALQQEQLVLRREVDHLRKASDTRSADVVRTSGTSDALVPPPPPLTPEECVAELPGADAAGGTAGVALEAAASRIAAAEARAADAEARAADAEARAEELTAQVNSYGAAQAEMLSLLQLRGLRHGDHDGHG